MIGLSLLMACTSGDDSGEKDSGSETTTGVDICGDTGSADAYVDGIAKDGQNGLYRFTIISAVPSPPDKGVNTWTIGVDNFVDGSALAGATVALTPFMPEHEHGTNPAVVPTTEGDGSYVSDGFDLFMGGFWEITIAATGTDIAPDQSVFRFCIEG